ncbi:hypothetical protein BCV69DRAFT_200388 [Microstroma glucosiphilum]|uniref:Uncharacterized protein n=1 Tax=Pseudomicrostroma glucosiphilum TaxID=1684307 RepID=A0A316U8N0_9BASI|nr:hypothetical protein BCV69DRAFT_200388 [Pseudomicrostroma glucosiphilum]PWN20821.1 hypothetical protein BCV69DRAFT_200388 [Pseudomicrostroma glucosiphilum]
MRRYLQQDFSPGHQRISDPLLAAFGMRAGPPLRSAARGWGPNLHKRGPCSCAVSPATLRLARHAQPQCMQAQEEMGEIPALWTFRPSGLQASEQRGARLQSCTPKFVASQRENICPAAPLLRNSMILHGGCTPHRHPSSDYFPSFPPSDRSNRWRTVSLPREGAPRCGLGELTSRVWSSSEHKGGGSHVTSSAGFATAPSPHGPLLALNSWSAKALALGEGAELCRHSPKIRLHVSAGSLREV